MTRDDHAALADLARLRAEISADRAAMVRCVADVDMALAAWHSSPPDRPLLVLAAVGLHGWYTALESVLERTARSLDDSVPRGESWHRDLVSQALVDLPGVRPAVLPREMLPSLLAILAFRHFFRHAYAVDLDPVRLRAEVDRLKAIDSAVGEALDHFDAFLGTTIDAVGSGLT